MPEPIFAAAQCCARAGDLAANLRRHLDFVAQARAHGVRFLLFPELSLTGYEPALAGTLAQAPDTPLLAPLRAAARAAAMTVVAGLPLRATADDAGKPRIASFVLHADGALTVHTKQHLHAGEVEHFRAGDGGAPLDVDGLPLALSICADFAQPAHAAGAAQAGARLYATSVLVGEGGYAVDSTILQGHATRHRMAVLMANHGGPTGGWTAAGRSAFWDETGHLVAAAPGAGDCLLVVARRDGAWQGSVVPVTGAD